MEELDMLAHALDGGKGRDKEDHTFSRSQEQEQGIKRRKQSSGSLYRPDSGSIEIAEGLMTNVVNEHDRCSFWTTTSTLHSEEPEDCSRSTHDGLPEEEDDPTLDILLACSSLALRSAQDALQATLTHRTQLARLKADERALELLLARREAELLTQLEATRHMAEYVEERTAELQSLLKSSTTGSFREGSRRNLSSSSSRGGWDLGTSTRDSIAGERKGAAAQLTGIDSENSVAGILEPPHDPGVTIGKSAARRLEKILGRQASSREGSCSAGVAPGGSCARSLPRGKRDARDLLASPSASASDSTVDDKVRSPTSEASPFGFFSIPYSPRRADRSSYLSARSSSGVTTVTAASFTTAESASTMAELDTTKEQKEELVDDGDSSSVRALSSSISPSLPSWASLTSPGRWQSPSYFSSATTKASYASPPSTTTSRSNSPAPAALKSRQQLHRSHPSAPSVISVSSTTTASSSIWSPGCFTVGDWNTADPFVNDPQAGGAAASATGSAAAVVSLRRPGHLQRRSASASAASVFSVVG